MRRGIRGEPTRDLVPGGTVDDSSGVGAPVGAARVGVVHPAVALRVNFRQVTERVVVRRGGVVRGQR